MTSLGFESFFTDVSSTTGWGTGTSSSADFGPHAANIKTKKALTMETPQIQERQVENTQKDNVFL